MLRKFLFFLLFSSEIFNSFGQCPTTLYSVDDSTGANMPLNLSNLSIGAQSYDWDFCPGDLDSVPKPNTIPLAIPNSYELKLVKDNGNYYAFLINYGGNQIARLNFGNDLNSTPSLTYLTNNPLTTTCTGIDFAKEGNKWYAFVSDFDKNTVYKLVFDSITQLNPVVTDMNLIGVSIAYQVKVFNHFVFVSSRANNKIVVLNFGNSYANVPVQLPDITGMSQPIGIDVAYDSKQGKYFGYAAQLGKVTRLDFGSSLSNAPLISDAYIATGNGFLYGIDIAKDGKNWYVMTVSANPSFILLKGGENLDDTLSMIVSSDLNAGITGTCTGLSLIRDSSYWHALVSNVNNNVFHLKFPNHCNVNYVSSTDSVPSNIAYSPPVPGWQYVSLEGTDTISGCKSYFVDSTFIRLPPTVDFSVASLCQGDSVVFTDLTTVKSDSIVNWKWYFGDGDSSSIKNPRHKYAGPGTYLVSLVVRSYYGYIFTDTLSVTIHSLPVSDFYFNNNQCANAPVQFSDSSHVINGSISAWKWYFGNGDSSLIKDPVYTFNNATINKITLYIADTHGCIDTVSKNLTTIPAPSAHFATSNTCNSDSTILQNLTDSNGLPNVTYLWDFGDSQSSTLVNVRHLYPIYGPYNILLTAIGSNGCIDSVTSILKISRKATPVFTFSPSIACTGNVVAFYDSSKAASGDSIIYRHWDFNDGDSLSNTIQASHIFLTNGNYNVTLTVKTPSNCDTSITHSITVVESPTANFTVIDNCFGIPVDFTNQTNSVPGDTVLNYLWKFGDNTSQAVYDTSHAYNTAGNYNVTLIATSNAGCIDSILKTATTYPKPVASFTNYPTVCTDSSVSFIDLSSVTNDTINQWDWDFGDTGQSGQQNPFHTYTVSGTKLANLIVTTKHGCTDAFGKAITINQSPSPDFNYTRTCLGQNTCFTSKDNNIPPNTITGWTWNFGSGNISQQSAPCYLFSTPGLTNVSLLLQDNKGCKTQITKTVNINARPKAGFFTSLPCSGKNIVFTDTSHISLGQIITHKWIIGNTDTIVLSNINYTATNSGLLSAVLIVSSDSVCYDTLTRYISVQPSPAANFTSSPLFSEPGEDVQFTNLSSQSSIYSWDFGDATTPVAVQDPLHIYQDTGLFYVTLIATNINGCADTVIKPHNVVNALLDIAVINISSAEQNNLITLSALVFNSSNIDINNFEIIAELDGFNNIYEFPILSLPVGSSPQWYTFQSKVHYDQSNKPEFYCIEALNPNGLQDNNISNNRFCKSAVSGFDILSVLPNPAIDYCTLIFNLPVKGEAEINIIDAQGAIHKEIHLTNLIKGYNFYTLNTSALSKGVYAFRITYNDESKVKRFVKM